MRLANGCELTYCTNIHPANGWPDVFQSLRQYGPALKADLSPEERFGLGLRLSATEAAALREPGRLTEFQEFLAQHNLYVALINGFPYGNFHTTPVKAQVFAPDWRTADRREYTLDLFEILARLVPENIDGGVSTAPLSYKGWIAPSDERAWEQIQPNVLAVVDAAVRLRRETGRYLHLDIEPEPNGLVENTQEFIAFFQRLLRFAPPEAEAAIRDHVTVCFDICHAAVEYEDPSEALDSLEREGIRVGRVQISSALRVMVPHDSEGRRALAGELQRFVDPVYLHQVIARRADGSLELHPDLAEALPALETAAGEEWRIHFHVPLFTDRYASFGSTQDVIVQVVERLRRKAFTRHLEIETYTWSILPAELKADLRASIEREYRWVLSRL